jgi:thiamine biosynthesis lipoprotein
MRRRAQPWLGTLVEISIADQIDDVPCQAAFGKAFRAVAEVHARMGFHDPDSEVSQINRAAPGAVTRVHAATWTVLSVAERIRRDSHGLFDIACAPVLVATGHLPCPEVTGAQFRPGSAVIALEPDCMVRKLARGWIDLGGIAKGYAVDMAIDALRQAGIASACVNAGGDLRTYGAADFGVAVRAPWRDAGALALPALRNAAIATSAMYYLDDDYLDDDYLDDDYLDDDDLDDEQAMAGGSHIINGRDGRPVRGAASVSVIAPACMIADALTKVVLCAGRVDSALLEEYGALAFTLGPSPG